MRWLAVEQQQSAIMSAESCFFFLKENSFCSVYEQNRHTETLPALKCFPIKELTFWAISIELFYLVQLNKAVKLEDKPNQAKLVVLVSVFTIHATAISGTGLACAWLTHVQVQCVSLDSCLADASIVAVTGCCPSLNYFKCQSCTDSLLQ